MQKRLLTSKERDNWVEALRSGKYKQSRRALKGQNGYCCLGVLAKTLRFGDEALKNKGCLSDVSNMPVKLGPPVGRVVGKPSGDHDAESRLISLNDSAKRNFRYIADWILKHVQVEG